MSSGFLCVLSQVYQYTGCSLFTAAASTIKIKVDSEDDQDTVSLGSALG